MRANLSLRDYEQISAYLDGQLSPRDKARFEQQLRARPELKSAYDDMSRTRALLRMAPHRRAPRNFTLTPAMVEKSQPKRTFGFNLFPALSFASALAALLLVATILFELMPGASMTATQTGAAPEAASNADPTILKSVPEATAAADAQLQGAPAAGAPAARTVEGEAPIITWGIPPATNMGSSIYGQGGGPGIDAMGKGGGGGGGMGIGGGADMPGVGGGAPDGNLVVPYDSAQTLPETSQSQELEAQQDFSSVPTLEGSGPILGVPPADMGGQYNSPLPTPLPARELSSDTVEKPTNEAVTQPAGISLLRWVQLGLGAIVLITALAALWAWRRTH